MAPERQRRAVSGCRRLGAFGSGPPPKPDIQADRAVRSVGGSGRKQNDRFRAAAMRKVTLGLPTAACRSRPGADIRCVDVAAMIRCLKRLPRFATSRGRTAVRTASPSKTIRCLHRPRSSAMGSASSDIRAAAKHRSCEWTWRRGRASTRAGRSPRVGDASTGPLDTGRPRGSRSRHPISRASRTTRPAARPWEPPAGVSKIRRRHGERRRRS